jgi:hypothetical protein
MVIKQGSNANRQPLSNSLTIIKNENLGLASIQANDATSTLMSTIQIT